MTHVGLYVGDGRFLSATTYQAPVVREDSLDDPHWAPSSRGAAHARRTRPIAEAGDPGPRPLLAYLAGVVAVVFQASRLPRLQPLFDRLPALVWAYWLPMLSTTAGSSPRRAPLPSDDPLPAARLAGADAPVVGGEVDRAAGPRALVMAAGVAGIIAGSIAGFLALRPWLPPEAWKAVGALSATWIGGSANLVAVATALGLSPDRRA